MVNAICHLCKEEWAVLFRSVRFGVLVEHECSSTRHQRGVHCSANRQLTALRESVTVVATKAGAIDPAARGDDQQRTADHARTPERSMSETADRETILRAAG